MELKVNLEGIAECLREQISSNKFRIILKRGTIEVYSRSYRGNDEITELLVSINPYRKEAEFHKIQHKVFRRSFEEETGLGPIIYFLVKEGYRTNVEDVDKARLRGTEWRERGEDEITPHNDRFFKSEN
jgi:hypothetical protein